MVRNGEGKGWCGIVGERERGEGMVRRTFDG